MVESVPSSGTVWLVAIALGVGTYAFRISFIQLQDWIEDLPPTVETALTFIPPAILAALITPEVFVLEEGVVRMVFDPRVVAAGLAFVVAWRTGNMLATIGVGMGTLWTVQFVVG